MNKIYIESTFDKLKQMLDKEKNLFLIVDKNLRYYHNLLAPYNIIWIEVSEEKKRMETVLQICKKLLEFDADRNSLLAGVGGGITTDLTGFAAAIYKRGVRSAFVPTTLLAQTDASIGGKNGVNFNSYKNILGTITLPEWIYICPEFLKTLPPREFISGTAEILKTMLISGYGDYREAADYFIKLKNDNYFDDKKLSGIIRKCVRLKSDIVKRDLQEKGERRLLNFGHTFAHAIEKTGAGGKCGGDVLNHGEAVAVGIITASKYACNSGMVGKSFVKTLIDDFTNIGLPVSVPSPLSPEMISEAISKDKKVFGEDIHLILPTEENGGIAIRDCLIPLKELDAEKFDVDL